MLNHATCNNANHAPVPVGTVNDVAEAVFRGLLQLDERLVGRRLVHLTASVVHLFDFAGHFRCTGIAFFHQQVHHPLRVVHASGGIDARPQREADVADGLRRLVNVCGAHQREDARSLTFAQLPQSLGGHDAVFAFEIDQIRTDTDGHKVEFLVDATFGQVHAVRKGLKQLECHPATGQFLERIRAIAALGVQDREGFREGVFRQMVVAHDDVDAAFGCPWLTLLVGTALIPFALAGVILVFAYNWPLKHFGLGEPTVIMVWGPLMVGGGYLSITGAWSWAVAWASLPYAIGATIVLFGKHIDKIAEPVRTLPKLLGRKLAKATAATALICQHVASLLLVRAGILPAACLLSLVALPFETRAAVRILLTEEPPAEKPSSDVSYRGSILPFVPAKAWPLWYVAVAGWQAVVYGYWFTLGLVMHDQISHAVIAALNLFGIGY